MPLDTVNDMRSMDVTGRSRSEIARVLHVSRTPWRSTPTWRTCHPSRRCPRGGAGPRSRATRNGSSAFSRPTSGPRGSSATPPGGSTTGSSPSAATPARTPPSRGSSASSGLPGRRRAERGTQRYLCRDFGRMFSNTLPGPSTGQGQTAIRRRPIGGSSELARIVGNAPNARRRNLSMAYFRL